MISGRNNPTGAKDDIDNQVLLGRRQIRMDGQAKNALRHFAGYR
jgi:hypothetical protein